MLFFRKLWRSLKQEDRPIAASMGLLGFAVAFISLIVAALQAALLFSQRRTPYTTAVYVRQLEVASDFAGAAQAQVERLNTIVRMCGAGARAAAAPTVQPLLSARQIADVQADYPAQIKDYRSGLDTLGNALAETLVIFPTEDHAVATDIFKANRDIYNDVISNSPDCAEFNSRYDSPFTDERVRTMSVATERLVTALRTRLAVEPLSDDTPVMEAIKNQQQEDRVDRRLNANPSPLD